MKKNGFSLIELMIAVGIVGILAAIAIPSYSAYVKRTNRTDATRSLSVTAQALERCYSQNFSYAVATCPVAGVTPTPSSQGVLHRDYRHHRPHDLHPYRGTAFAPQTADAACTQFTLTNTGLQSALPAATHKPAGCST